MYASSGYFSFERFTCRAQII